jgi:hypothetical protein
MAYDDEKGGRPPVYDESFHPDRAYELIAETGANNAKLARSFRVSKQTIFRWLADHEEFRDQVLAAQDVWNTQLISGALVKRAVGFSAEEIHRELIGTKLYVTKKIRKFIVPNTEAIKFALTNFAPRRFSEKKEVKVETPDTLELVINTGKELVEKD